MRKTVSVLTVVGARPQFIKAAPVSAAFVEAGGFRETLVHTGQHFDQEMSGAFFAELGLPEPICNLGIHGGGHGAMTGRMLAALEEQVSLPGRIWVLIYGDTNSTLAGAIAAAKLRVPVAHVEAGLRSFNRAMPEETNRVVADHVSDLLLCPTARAMENLRLEGIVRGVHNVGDVMFDASLIAARRPTHNAILQKLGLTPQSFAVATVHRAENVDDLERLQSVLAYLRNHARDMTTVFPVHPRTRDAISRAGIETAPLRLCAPLPYLEMTHLLAACTVVITDSGGLQKEAYFHGKPCVTLRDETEWVETIECGWNRLWTVPTYQPRRSIAEYGDGHAAQKIVKLLGELSR